MRKTVTIVAAVIAAAFSTAFAAPDAWAPASAGDVAPGVVQCANLIYGQGQSSVCFSDEFLAQIQKDTNIRTNRRFCPVKLEGPELYQYPFAMMTGQGQFTLTPAQRANLRNYLSRGGFLVASAGCSSGEWDASFRAEISQVFPELKLQRLSMSHPIFHTVYDLTDWTLKHGGSDVYLEGLEVDGKIVLVYSKEGLNDTARAGPGCCCCGGNEIHNSRQVNANLLAYALTH